MPRAVEWRWLVGDFWVLLLACVLLGGCGAPGDPQTRRPPVPVAITDLAAHQAGSGVALTFTLPKKTIEGEKLSEPPTIEIYRGFTPPESPQKKANSRLVFAIPSALVDNYLTEGRMEFVDPIPAEELASHPGEQTVYIVRTRVSKKRASADSNAAVLRVYPVPVGISDAKANVTETAIETGVWSGNGARSVGHVWVDGVRKER